jgi:HSP20 family molecular chaperone IbpA
MNRKKRFFDDFWNFNLDEMLRSFQEEIDSIKQYNSEYQEGDPISYGYSVRIGPNTNYQPEIRQWGNLNDYRKKQGLSEINFPLKGISEHYLPSKATSSSNRYIEFIDEDDYLKVIVEVPGFTKENLNIEIDETGMEITLSGNSQQKELKETIILPSKIEAKTTKSSVKNGVLEIRGKKTGNTSSKINVKID